MEGRPLHAKGHAGPWCVLIVADTFEDTEYVSQRLDELGVTPSQDYFDLDTSAPYNDSDWFPSAHTHLALNDDCAYFRHPDLVIRRFGPQDDGSMPYYPNLLCKVTLECLANRGEEIATFLRYARDKNINGGEVYRRCAVFCRLAPSMEWPNAVLQYTGYHDQSTALVELCALVEITEPKLSEDRDSKSLRLDQGVNKAVRLIKVINNLPSQEASAHWHYSFSRFMHDSIVRNDEEIVYVYRSCVVDGKAVDQQDGVDNVAMTFEEKPDEPTREDWSSLEGMDGKTFRVLITYHNVPGSDFEPDARAVEECFRNSVPANNIIFEVEVESVSAERLLQTILSARKPFFWYHAGHGQEWTIPGGEDYSDFKDRFGDDVCHVAFLNMCHGFNLQNHIKRHIDNILYWDGRVGTTVAKDVGLDFVKHFVALFTSQQNDPLAKCVKRAYLSVWPRPSNNDSRTVSNNSRLAQLMLTQVEHRVVPLSDVELSLGNRMKNPTILKASPANLLSLTRASRDRGNIPDHAHFYSFVHPAYEPEAFELEVKKARIDGTCSLGEIDLMILGMLLRHGGFMYLNERKEVLQVNAYSKKVDVLSGRIPRNHRGVLNTDSYQNAPPRLINKLLLADRFSCLPASYDERTESYSCLAWLRPNEYVHESLIRFSHGAFVEITYELNGPRRERRVTKGIILAIRKSA